MPTTAGGDGDDKRSLWIQIARYSQLAFVLPAATVAGWILGELLDRLFHTQFLYIVGLLLGIVAGFVELIRTAGSGEK